MGIEEVLGTQREAILAIAAQHGAYNVQVFGSVARGDATPDSDIDLLVELEPGRNLLDRIALIQALEELLHCKVDVAKAENLHPWIRLRVLEKAIHL